jgi:hypothetical protein
MITYKWYDGPDNEERTQEDFEEFHKKALKNTKFKVLGDYVYGMIMNSLNHGDVENPWINTQTQIGIFKHPELIMTAMETQGLDPEHTENSCDPFCLYFKIQIDNTIVIQFSKYSDIQMMLQTECVEATYKFDVFDFYTLTDIVKHLVDYYFALNIKGYGFFSVMDPDYTVMYIKNRMNELILDTLPEK